MELALSKTFMYQWIVGDRYGRVSILEWCLGRVCVTGCMARGVIMCHITLWYYPKYVKALFILI